MRRALERGAYLLARAAERTRVGRYLPVRAATRELTVRVPMSEAMLESMDAAYLADQTVWIASDGIRDWMLTAIEARRGRLSDDERARVLRRRA